MKVVLPKIIFRGWFRAAMSVSYTAFLDVSKDSVLFLSGLLHTERVRRGTRAGTRALSTYRQAVLVLRWFLDDARMAALARDNSIGKSTAYAYLGEAIIALAARRPGLHGALLAAKAAGHTHVILDGTLIATDRSSAPGPTPGVDLWWSGKHHHHGGNIQVLSAPGLGHRRRARAGRPRLRRRGRPAPRPVQETQRRCPDQRPANLQRRPRRAALPR